MGRQGRAEVAARLLPDAEIIIEEPDLRYFPQRAEQQNRAAVSWGGGYGPPTCLPGHPKNHPSVRQPYCLGGARTQEARAFCFEQGPSDTPGAIVNFLSIYSIQSMELSFGVVFIGSIELQEADDELSTPAGGELSVSRRVGSVSHEQGHQRRCGRWVSFCAERPQGALLGRACSAPRSIFFI